MKGTYLVNKCMFFGTKWSQNNILSFTLPSSQRIAIISMTKFYIVLWQGSDSMDEEDRSIHVIWTKLFGAYNTLHIIYNMVYMVWILSSDYHTECFIRYNLYHLNRGSTPLPWNKELFAPPQSPTTIEPYTWCTPKFLERSKEASPLATL